MRSFFALSLLAFALATQAQLYRWTDENGKAHYTDMPPPANATNVQKKSSAGAGGAGHCRISQGRRTVTVSASTSA
jgi:hypothetical protein